MFTLNESDVNNLKYLIASTRWVRYEEIMDIKNENDLLKTFEDTINRKAGVDSMKTYFENLINECFYHLKCYNRMHLKKECPKIYVEDDYNWGYILSNEAILLLRLYQNLLSDEFFCLLESVFAITREQYMNFQVDSEILYGDDFICKIHQWLVEKEDPFAEKVQKLLDRLDNSGIQEEFKLKPRVILESQGICLIINIENCRGNSKRNGTMVDEENITKTFSDLNFDVVTYRDVLKDNLFKILEFTKSKVNNNDRMFVAFFLSHGKKGTFITSDGKEVKFKKLWDPFRGSQCGALSAKPKLFFFVCCQGTGINQAISINDSQIVSSTLECDAINKNATCPDISNFFFGYATYKTLTAYRHTSNGTFYINYLCETIRNYPAKSISEIHEKVQGLFNETEIPDKDCYQMPYFENLLTEHYYLIDNRTDLN